MTSPSRHKVFNRSDRVIEGWYWALRSTDLARGEVRSVDLMGKPLAVFRGQNGKVVALDAHCPHMGANLAEGRVEGNGLRCAFHQWKFDGDGRCVNVPCQAKPPPAQSNSWPVDERYGLIWIYTARIPRHPVPAPPELEREEVDALLGASFERPCHPHVVLSRGIDAQRFYSVHELPQLLDFESRQVTETCMTFRNTRKVATDTWLGRLASRFFFKESVHYSMAAWNGSTCTLTFGPDFLHFHLLLALRLTAEGGTEGQLVLLTPKRRGPFGWLFNRLLLFVTGLLGRAFLKSDEKVLGSIRFDLRMPLRADRAIIDFAQHVENQRVTRWGVGQLPEGAGEQTPLPAATLAFRPAKPTLRN